MPLVGHLKEGEGIGDLFAQNMARYSGFLKYAEAVMRGASELSPGVRELIASYVSALNGCDYCREGHSSTMAALGIEASLIDQLLADIDTARIDDKLKPVLKYCRKLTLAPSKVVAGDIDDILAAGWDEEAVHSAIAVTCRFNYMNRLVMGLGFSPQSPEMLAKLTEQRIREGYASLPPGGLGDSDD